MKRTILAATIAFWCVMIGAVIAGTVSPPSTAPQPVPAGAPGSVAAAAPPSAASSGTERIAQAPAKPANADASAKAGYTLKEVAQHATPKDCWMVIHGKVYDFSAYIPQHPSAPEVMTRHCGKEATRAFDTKDRGRPHGDYAKGLLAKYEVGVLRE
jgi:cytochrome b involved in lipid metabolism